jgi:hypothetical protein
LRGEESSGIHLRGRADLVNVSFPGGTNLLYVLANGAHKSLGRDIQFNGCRFRAADVPAGLDVARLGITPLGQGDLSGLEG